MKNFLIFAVLITSTAFGQNLIESRQSSYYSYVYNLTDQEAETIYRKGIWKVDDSYFHSLVDSFPTHDSYHWDLQQGHYLLAYAKQNHLEFSIYSIQDFEIKILNNKADLNIQVIDIKGLPIENANVNLGWNKLSFDKKTQCYKQRKSNHKGLLKVEHDGFTAYQNLDKRYKNSFIRRTSNTILYRTPIKYVWGPVWFTARIPYDGTRSIISGHTRGTISSLKFYYNRIFSNNNHRNVRTKGYMVFNKPIYKPADSVKLKAFILDKKNKPINEPLFLKINNHKGKLVYSKLIYPYRKGGYEHEFKLMDSLDLRLDYNYPVYLEDKKGITYYSSFFRYENYELSKIELMIRLQKDCHYKNEPLTIFAKGMDENGFNLPDGKLNLVIKPIEMIEFYENSLFLPDTLWTYSQSLDMLGETKVIIPDSFLPQASLKYKIVATLLTSDNEKVEKTVDATFLLNHNEIKYSLEKDSITIDYLVNGKSTPTKALLTIVNENEKKIETQHVNLPLQISNQHHFYKYQCLIDSLSSEFIPSNEPDLIQCYSSLTSDSLYVTVDNPRKIPFTYFLYKKNMELERGTAIDLEFHKKVVPNQKYYVSLQYVWGGKSKDVDYEVPFNNKKVNIELNAPKLVYPGQVVDVKIKTTDINGKAIPGMDITAQGITKKFNYNPQQVPYLGKKYKDRTIINEFFFNEHKTKKDYNLLSTKWLDRLGLDSIEYYKFIYPNQQLYTVTLPVHDSITQFAPYVVHRGDIEPVHIIYLNHEPIYFSWTSPKQPYSFRIWSAKNHIMLRTRNKLITIQNMEFEKGVKTLFAVNDTLANDQVEIKDMPYNPTDIEKNNLGRYLFSFRNNNWDRLAYIRQQDRYFVLNPNLKFNGAVIGPIKPSDFSFYLINKAFTTLIHEPGFEYDLMPNLVKMRTKYNIFPTHFPYSVTMPFSDSVLTESGVQNLWLDHINQMRISGNWFANDNQTQPGNGSLIVNFNQTKRTPLNFVLLKSEDPNYLKIYPGNTNAFHNLDPGLYLFATFFANDEYFLTDSVEIKSAGTLYLKLEFPEILKKDSFSTKTAKIIIEKVLQPYYQRTIDDVQRSSIIMGYNQSHTYEGEGRIITGRILDNEGEALPGVNVIVKGTIIGTVSDIDGYYSIKVPSDRNELVFSSIGYVTEEVFISLYNAVDVKLNPDVQALQEVVIIGYGVQQKQSITGSVTTVISGGMPGVKIRGTSTIDSEKEPLYVVDGVPLTAELFKKLKQDEIEDIEVLNETSGTAIYGSRGANGVLLIKTKSGSSGVKLAMEMMGVDYDSTFFEGAKSKSSIRNNFSDYAIWQPKLTTNNNGEAAFQVKFPDDITNWQTIVYAIDDKKHSGRIEYEIKSFKPVMAQLSLPNFLLEEDTVFVIGKSMNYTADSVDIKTKFEINGKSIKEKDFRMLHSLVDSCQISIVDTDTISIKYYLQKQDGYFDGEERKIAVHKIGMEKSEGHFLTLDSDTTFSLQLNKEATTHLYAQADLLEVLLEETERVIEYKYLCNEQMASKLKSLLAKRRIYEVLGRKFEEENQIKDLIRKLNKNQKGQDLWGWWGNTGSTSYWISLHVLEALIEADQMGFRTDLDKILLVQWLSWEFNDRNYKDKIRLLKILDVLGTDVDFENHIKKLEKQLDLTLYDKFSLIELKQKHKLNYSLDSLWKYKKTSLLGNLYFDTDVKENHYSVSENHVLSTLTAYRILKNKGNYSKELIKIRNFLLESRKQGCWRNTYESSLIVETILPDILKDKNKLSQPLLEITGDMVQKIDTFPYYVRTNNLQKLNLKKSGDAPIYFTAYQQMWDKSPKLKEEIFNIKTYFNDRSEIGELKAGENTTLTVTLEVENKVDYVMLEIPIPAGCSYGKKTNWNRGETYREYFQTHTCIFIEHLMPGKYEYQIDLIPRFTGSFTLNPAKAELMYFPTFYGNEKVKKVFIQ